MRPRTATGWAALVLGLLLVVSNVWWMYVSFDNAVTTSYREDQLEFTQRALNDALALIPLLDAPSEKAELVAEAEQLFQDESFEKEGCVWVGHLGLKFDEDDRLIHVSRNWNFGEEDPCFPQ